jgi:hypothetical protein
MNYEIKITGSGTAKQIEMALRQIARQIQDAADNNKEEEELSDAKWEDSTLMTEISADGIYDERFKDKDGEPIEKGDTVIVPEPNGKEDAWNHSFQGTVIGFRNGYVQVEDGDNDVFDVEPNRLEIDLD